VQILVLLKFKTLSERRDERFEEEAFEDFDLDRFRQLIEIAEINLSSEP